jgi:hypothetical protein
MVCARRPETFGKVLYADLPLSFTLRLRLTLQLGFFSSWKGQGMVRLTPAPEGSML